MNQIVVLSGKGGSGKTTICASIAFLAAQHNPIAVVDADVDAANLALLFTLKNQQKFPFVGGVLASIDLQNCIACGMCEQVCRFAAVQQDAQGNYQIDPLSCEGCAACYYQCPSSAIELMEQQNGTWHRAETPQGVFFDAHLFPGQENSGRLVTHIIQQARDEANAQNIQTLLVDGPPGIGCPVIAACTNSNIALLIAEPTITGLHDIERIFATVKHFRIPAYMVINKADINANFNHRIQEFCAQNDIAILAEIPFDEIAVKAMLVGKTVTEYSPQSLISQKINKAWQQLAMRLIA